MIEHFGKIMGAILWMAIVIKIRFFRHWRFSTTLIFGKALKTKVLVATSIFWHIPKLGKYISILNDANVSENAHRSLRKAKTSNKKATKLKSSKRALAENLFFCISISFRASTILVLFVVCTHCKWQWCGNFIKKAFLKYFLQPHTWMQVHCANANWNDIEKVFSR